MSASPVKWDPPCLTFPVAIGKPSVQQLRAINSSDQTYTFKVKTTNPKRYSVRPNVGVVWPGQEVTVTVQLPAMKELPTDMQKCKDKFQVLTLKLDPKASEELLTKSAEVQRTELTAIWAADSAKEASVDKIRCAFAFDASYRDAPIPEEEHPIAPYSPETVPPGEGGGGSPNPKGGATPYAESKGDDEDGPQAAGAAGSASAASPGRSPSSRGGGSQKQLDSALEAAALREQLEAAVQSAAKQRDRAEQAAAQVAALETELQKAQKLNVVLEKKAKQAASAGGGGGSNAAASSGGSGGGGGGGFGTMAMVMLFLSGIGAGYLLAPAKAVAAPKAAPIPTPAAAQTYKAPHREPDEL